MFFSARLGTARRTRSMHVTIIGAGNMGRGIGHRIVAGGHSVTIVDRDAEEANQLMDALRGVGEGGATVAAAEPGAELRGEAVVLAVYYPGNLEIARDLGDRLAGKVVVDISNPLNETFDALATAPGTSAAEEVAQSAPAGARVVKAFNTTFSGTLVEGQVRSEEHTSELQSRQYLVCRLLLEKKKKKERTHSISTKITYTG